MLSRHNWLKSWKSCRRCLGGQDRMPWRRRRNPLSDRIQIGLTLTVAYHCLFIYLFIIECSTAAPSGPKISFTGRQVFSWLGDVVKRCSVAFVATTIETTRRLNAYFVKNEHYIHIGCHFRKIDGWKRCHNASYAVEVQFWSPFSIPIFPLYGAQ